MIHVSLFFRSLFLCPIYKVLTGPVSPENSLLRFWMSYSLSEIFYRASFNRITSPFQSWRNLHTSRNPCITSRIFCRPPSWCRGNHYRHGIQEVCSPGKIEISIPNLDWRIIWIETTALPNHIGESMFLFNKRLLLTKTRCHRLDPLSDRNCPLCQQEPETDEHLMTYCQLRHQLKSWLEGMVRQLGCRAIPDEIIRGNIGPTENLRTIFALVAAYIFTTWKERCYQRNPTEVEVKKP